MQRGNASQSFWRRVYGKMVTQHCSNVQTDLGDRESHQSGTRAVTIQYPVHATLILPDLQKPSPEEQEVEEQQEGRHFLDPFEPGRNFPMMTYDIKCRILVFWFFVCFLHSADPKLYSFACLLFPLVLVPVLSGLLCMADLASGMS